MSVARIALHPRGERFLDFSVLDLALVANLLLLLLIGMGPKIALVPFLDATKGFEPARKKKIGTRMVLVGVSAALILFLLGNFLMNLLHVSAGAVSVAGGIVLMTISLKMITASEHSTETKIADPEDDDHLAVYPLAIPYMLNPAGIVILLVASSKVPDLISWGLVVGVILVVGAFDMLVFRNIEFVAKRMTPTKLVISEVIFGILLTALAVEMLVLGLNGLGVISLSETAH